ncbi:MAG TPA: hypothetical protein VF281_03070 [Candidatus Saccharimonadales bacterium]
MARRANTNAFEQAKINHDKVINKTPIGRTALINSIDSLTETGDDAVKNGTITIQHYAETMQSVLTPIDSEEYTKPPLREATFSEYAGKLAVFNMINSANIPEEAPAAPTDTSKIDTAKRKA